MYYHFINEDNTSKRRKTCYTNCMGVCVYIFNYLKILSWNLTFLKCHLGSAAVNLYIYIFF